MKKIVVNLKKCLGCRSCEIACALEHSLTGELHQAVFEADKPQYRIFVLNSEGNPLPLACRHCVEPECLAACKSGGISYDFERGVIVFDRERCVGCWMCVMNCSFGAIVMERDASWADKCDLCPDLEIPACVEACPTRALREVEAEAVYE